VTDRVTGWADVLAVAIAGTGHVPLPADGGDAGSPEQRLLDAAARLAVQRLAGWRPPPMAGSPPPRCEPEPAPYVPAAAAARLADLLRTRHSERLPEWLDLAGASGQVVPPELLPELLEAVRARPDLRPSALRVGGVRGRWLAAANPEWTFPDGATGHQHLDEGELSLRAAALRTMRRADPDAAREHLEGRWAGEPGRHRALLLQALRMRLAPADEPFLERCLADPASQVRAVGADLLARLPESALVARMLARAAPLVVVGEGPTLTVAPPATCTPEMIADGVEPEPPAGVGRRAWWLSQVIERVPPSTWPLAAIGPALAGDWSWPLLRGWSLAAERFRDPDWAEALLEAYAAADPRQRWRREVDFDLLLRVLPVTAREALVVRVLDRSADVGCELLGRCREPWGLELSRAYARIAPGSDTRALMAAYHHCDPAVADELVARAEAEGATVLAELASVFRERAEMRRELNP
jgi:uncharacterized protein DUF5691